VHADLSTGVLTKEMQNWVKKVRKGSRDLLLKLWDPLHISGTVRAGNATFCTQVINRGTNDRNAKLGQKGSE